MKYFHMYCLQAVLMTNDLFDAEIGNSDDSDAGPSQDPGMDGDAEEDDDDEPLEISEALRKKLAKVCISSSAIHFFDAIIRRKTG